MLPTDAERNNVAAHGVFSGTHTGPGGPRDPTGKSTRTDYVYVMQFDGDKELVTTGMSNNPASPERWS